MYKRYVSFGGAGDAWIVYLKSHTWNEDLLSNEEWVHVESNNDVKSVLDYIKKCYLQNDTFNQRKFNFECDPNYIENYRKGKWKDYIPVSCGIDGWCNEKGQTNIKVEIPFLRNHYNNEDFSERKPEYDFCIQVSGGAKNNRNWKFDPRILKKILTDKGYRVILVGTDKRYYDEKDQNNLVGKTSNVSEALCYIRKSNTFIGLSGFLNYWSSSMKIKNIFLEESPAHTERYFHKEWLKYARPIKYGSINEIMRIVNDK